MAPIISFEADAVIFDSDGVLVDTHASVVESWTTVCEQYGLPTHKVLTELAGVRADDTLGRYLCGDDLVAAVALLESLEVASAGSTVPIAGAIEFVASLPQGRFTFATSASRRLAYARWAGAGFRVPAAVITAESVVNGKPDPEPFLAAADLLGVDIARCVIFEDSPSGGQAALAAGGMVIAVGELAWVNPPMARVADLRSVALRDEGQAMVIDAQTSPA